MPSFKPKANKKIRFNKKNAVTLDGKHREYMNDFLKDEQIRIPELKQERSQLEEQLKTITTIEQRLDIQDRII